ncbi:MAG: tRNA pseudouridine(38-40) synthase TruA [Acidobacteriota bacterium]
MTFAITLAYDGTGFLGWQRQAAGPSVQGLLEDALRALEGAEVAVAGAGRTDAGVHALGQVASFSLSRPIEPDALVRALNAALPRAVRVVEAQAKPPAFHARFDATAKTYRYRICNTRVMSPFERQYAWHVFGPLDVEAMASAARVLEGHHDFAAFRATGGTVRTTERTIRSSIVRREASSIVVYEVTGDGFLRHMVRAVVGTLVEVGRGRRAASDMAPTLASRDRARAGATAPAEGLFLVSVEYRDL